MSTRLIYIDNLRAAMIALVVMVHAAVTYSGFGDWFYKDSSESLDLFSKVFFAVFQSFTQAYFMSILFLFAGFFAASSLQKKGPTRFLQDRFVRLGIPTLLFVFFFFPVCVMLSNPGLDIMGFYAKGLASFAFLSWTGPLWFALALLLFSCAYALLSRLGKKPVLRPNASTWNVLLLSVFIGLLSFFVRLFFPIDSSWYNFQLPYFPSYVVLFSLGVLFYGSPFFEEVDYRTGKKWLGASLLLGLPVWFGVMVFGGALQGLELFKGGMNWQAASYSLWEAYFCVTFSIGLIGVFREKLNLQSRIQKYLSDNSFPAYVFHAPVLIAVSVLFKGLAIHPVAKFLVVSAIAVPMSFAVADLVRRSGFLRKTFSS
jgi:glucans biosynthesis protein C